MNKDDNIIRCSNCKNQIHNGNNFCSNCGNVLIKNVSDNIVIKDVLSKTSNIKNNICNINNEDNNNIETLKSIDVKVKIENDENFFDFSFISLVIFCFTCLPIYLWYFLEYIGYNADYGDLIWMLPLLFLRVLGIPFHFINMITSFFAIFRLLNVKRCCKKTLHIILNILVLFLLFYYVFILYSNIF